MFHNSGFSLVFYTGLISVIGCIADIRGCIACQNSILICQIKMYSIISFAVVQAFPENIHWQYGLQQHTAAGQKAHSR